MNKSTFDYMPIRRRLDKLKQDSGMDAYEFCKIYAPERCKGSKDTARNYIAAVFSGSTSINNKPVIPDIEHLLNIVNSDQFPNVTLNYLVYGTEEPAKIVEKKDFDLNHWSHADFCELLWTLKTRYPKCISIIENFETATIDREELPFPDEAQKRSISINIEELDQIDYFPEKIFSLGQAIALFHNEMRDVEDNYDEDIRKYAFSKAINKMRSRGELQNPYLVDLSNCENKTPFIIFYGE